VMYRMTNHCLIHVGIDSSQKTGRLLAPLFVRESIKVEAGSEEIEVLRMPRYVLKLKYVLERIVGMRREGTLSLRLK
jgi:hypothetical protein